LLRGFGCVGLIHKLLTLLFHIDKQNAPETLKALDVCCEDFTPKAP
jgi:hypothetical protein